MTRAAGYRERRRRLISPGQDLMTLGERRSARHWAPSGPGVLPKVWRSRRTESWRLAHLNGTTLAPWNSGSRLCSRHGQQRTLRPGGPGNVHKPALLIANALSGGRSPSKPQGLVAVLRSLSWPAGPARAPKRTENLHRLTRRRKQGRLRVGRQQVAQVPDRRIKVEEQHKCGPGRLPGVLRLGYVAKRLLFGRPGERHFA